MRWCCNTSPFHALHIEFQERGGPRVHSCIWISNEPNIHNETAYLQSLKINYMQLPEPENEPDLFESIKTYLILSHSRT